MSLRICSSPAPALNSCFPKSNEAYNFLTRTPKSRSFILTVSLSSSSSDRKMILALSYPNLGKMILANRGFAKEGNKVRQVASIGNNPEGSGMDSSSRAVEYFDNWYQKMIKISPGNSLLLADYASFLKEIKLDYAKAEEYFGRAILANPNDGLVLTQFGNFLWETQGDASRAQIYYERAMHAASDHYFVRASYERFLREVKRRGES